MKKVLLLTCFGVLLYGSLMIYDYRDIVFYWDFAKPVGEVELQQDPVLSEAIDKFLGSNEMEGHETCVYQWFASDDMFAYVKILCGEFVKEGDKFSTKNNVLLQPARLEYDPTTNTVLGLELASANDFKSLRSLFPKQVYSIMRGSNEPPKRLLEEGYVRQQLPQAHSDSEEGPDVEGDLDTDKMVD